MYYPKLCNSRTRATHMSGTESDRIFSGSISHIYEIFLVPLIFQPYAIDLVNRLTSRPLTRVLEIAAGTGVVTRALAAALSDTASITATDLNHPMLEQARACGTSRPVEWRQADAMDLPFEDGTFDAVVCQFGVMFVPDKVKAFAEARRALRPGGVFAFNVWDRIEENEFAESVTTALEALFSDRPPRFLARTVHGYYDTQRIARDLRDAGFSAAPQLSTVSVQSRASSFRNPAIGYCQGSPLRNEIEAYDASRLEEATAFAAEAIARRFGRGEVAGKIQAHVILVER
jgi:ubiquinone/menaquinone biosynthesis C-methylase UbiE